MRAISLLHILWKSNLTSPLAVWTTIIYQIPCHISSFCTVRLHLDVRYLSKPGPSNYTIEEPASLAPTLTRLHIYPPKSPESLNNHDHGYHYRYISLFQPHRPNPNHLQHPRPPRRPRRPRSHARSAQSIGPRPGGISIALHFSFHVGLGCQVRLRPRPRGRLQHRQAWRADYGERAGEGEGVGGCGAIWECGGPGVVSRNVFLCFLGLCC